MQAKKKRAVGRALRKPEHPQPACSRGWTWKAEGGGFLHVCGLWCPCWEDPEEDEEVNSSVEVLKGLRK